MPDLTSDRPVRWGVLSTARIGLEKVIPAIQASTLGRVVALASRDGDRAAAAAEGLGIPNVHADYDALLVDPEVDAVYLPLPNHLHVSWAIRAMKAGKHVLCEKPAGRTAEEARHLRDVAARYTHLKVMEAFMYRFHPQWVRAREIVREGEIGELRTIQSFFSYFNADPDNIRNRPDYGGGGLLDIGCYCVSLSRWLFDAEPVRVLGAVDYDPDLGVDREASGVLDFGTGSATFTCGTQLARHQRVHIVGSEGRVEIEIPFNAPPDRPCRLWHQRGGETTLVEVPAADQYTLQADAFARAILDDAPVPTPLTDAVANLSVLDALVHSSASGAWAAPGGEGPVRVAM